MCVLVVAKVLEVEGAEQPNKKHIHVKAQLPNLSN